MLLTNWQTDIFSVDDYNQYSALLRITTTEVNLQRTKVCCTQYTIGYDTTKSLSGICIMLLHLQSYIAGDISQITTLYTLCISLILILNTFSVKCKLVEHLSMNMCVKLLNTSNNKLNGYRRVRRPISLVCRLAVCLLII